MSGVALVVVVVLSVALVLALATAVLLAVRLNRLRSVGTAVLLRPIPAQADQGWRHGTVQYGEDGLEYFRLTDLRPGPTLTLVRQRTEICGRRRPVGTEGDILDGLVVLELEPGADGRGGAYEVAMTPGAATAFQSWLEARQSERSQRRRSA